MEESVEARVGGRILGEIEELALDEILFALRLAVTKTAPATATASSSVTPHLRRPKSYPIPELEALVAQNFRNTHGVPLQLTGRYMPLVYKLVSTLVTAPYLKAIVVIDAEHQFDTTRLDMPAHNNQDKEVDNLNHVYVFRPAQCGPGRLRDLLARSEAWMMYGDHGSRAREWWGTIVIGGPLGITPIQTKSAPATSGAILPVADVTASWKGWMRVDREDVPGYFVGSSASEALQNRETRQDMVEAARWRAACQWGGFSFPDGHKQKDNSPVKFGMSNADGTDEIR